MFDSHAHVASEEFEADRDDVYQRAKAVGLSGWIEVGTSVEDSKKAIAVAEKYEGVYASVGVHPNEIHNLNEAAWQKIESYLSHPKVKAVGEVGLDFFRGGKLEEQLFVLRKFITLAQVKNLPVIFHVRDGADINAHDELLKLLASYSETERPRGVIHTYSGTLTQAKEYISLGMHLSFSGVITFKNTGELFEVAKIIPAEKMLIETDCPFLTPVPHRGKRNEPSYVAFVLQKLAEIRGESVEAISLQVLKNTRELFNL